MKGLAFLCLGQSTATDFGTSLIASNFCSVFCDPVHFKIESAYISAHAGIVLTVF